MALRDYLSSGPVIDTRRLRLRRMCANDAADLREWMPDPAVYTYWGKGPSRAEKNSELLLHLRPAGDRPVKERSVPALQPGL